LFITGSISNLSIRNAQFKIQNGLDFTMRNSQFTMLDIRLGGFTGPGEDRQQLPGFGHQPGTLRGIADGRQPAQLQPVDSLRGFLCRDGNLILQFTMQNSQFTIS
jgi:hypothetical protein